MAFDSICHELAPFLKQLSDDELAEIPRAAERARNRRGWASRATRPEQPVEILRIRGGVLLLRRKWMEEVFAHNSNPEIQQTQQWPAILRGALSTWLEYLPGDLEAWLSRQAEYLPEGLPQDVFNYRYAESVLDLLEELTPEQIGQALEVPVVLRVVQRFIQRGNPKQRQRLKKALKAWSPDGRGAPPKDLEKLQDVIIAMAVTAAKDRLAEGHRLRATLYKPGTFDASGKLVQELRKRDFRPDEIDAIVESKHLTGAAHRLVARRESLEPASVSAMASRGRSRLRPGR
jgi:hypothetical protein